MSDKPAESNDQTKSWMVRLSRAEAARMQADGSLRRFLEGFGLDTKTMSCREDGKDLVYEGAEVKKGNVVAESTPVLTSANKSSADTAPCPPNAFSVREDGSEATPMSRDALRAPAVTAGGNGE